MRSSTFLIAAGMRDDVGSGLLKVQVRNLLGPCLCFLKRLCLNAGGGGGEGGAAGMLPQWDKREG